MVNGDPQRIELDVDQVFMLYAAFCGDVSKTAHSAGISRTQVEDLALEYGWPERIKSLVDLTQGAKPGDVERGINRAMNFVQAHRWRIFLEGTLRALAKVGTDGDAMLDLFTTEKRNKDGAVVERVFSARALADISTALEKVHWMTYQALNDSPQERAKRVEKPADDAAQADVHARLAAALAAMRANSPRTQLEDAQTELAAHLSTKTEAHLVSSAQASALHQGLPSTTVEPAPAQASTMRLGPPSTTVEPARQL